MTTRLFACRTRQWLDQGLHQQGVDLQPSALGAEVHVLVAGENAKGRSRCGSKNSRRRHQGAAGDGAAYAHDLARAAVPR